MNKSLNPCCAGRCSSTLWRLKSVFTKSRSLNPCCAGRCSSTDHLYFISYQVEVSQSLLCWTMLQYTRILSQACPGCNVSILVVLDDALVRTENGNEDKANITVSILVVLDDALVRDLVSKRVTSRLNVSILVVLDDALVLEKQRLY